VLYRDAKRILAAARDTGVARIDYLVATHYHQDHIGGIPQIAALLPVGTYVDHGKNYETIKDVRALLAAYVAQRDTGRYVKVSAGMWLRIHVSAATRNNSRTVAGHEEGVMPGNYPTLGVSFAT
jgi:beta-lactamase superfamily II metal-dependent hydrolase